MNKSQEIEELEKKLSTLDAKIKDVEDRLPAHGIKPPIMTELFELEAFEPKREKEPRQEQQRNEEVRSPYEIGRP